MTIATSELEFRSALSFRPRTDITGERARTIAYFRKQNQITLELAASLLTRTHVDADGLVDLDQADFSQQIEASLKAGVAVIRCALNQYRQGLKRLAAIQPPAVLTAFHDSWIALNLEWHGYLVTMVDRIKALQESRDPARQRIAALVELLSDAADVEPNIRNRGRVLRATRRAVLRRLYIGSHDLSS